MRRRKLHNRSDSRFKVGTKWRSGSLLRVIIKEMPRSASVRWQWEWEDGLRTPAKGHSCLIETFIRWVEKSCAYEVTETEPAS